VETGCDSSLHDKGEGTSFQLFVKPMLILCLLWTNNQYRM